MMTGHQGDEPATAETPLYGDDEAVRASGVPLPSLRVLQAAGAIRSRKVPKAHGGYRRMWSEGDVLKAAVAAALGEHLAWNIRVVAAVMGKTPSGVWNSLIETALSGLREGQLDAPEQTLVRASGHDWKIAVFDRTFVFLTVPDVMTAILPGAVWKQGDLLLGVVGKDTFHPIPWRLGSREGRTVAERALGEEDSHKLVQLYRLAMAAHGNALSTAAINLSMQIRVARRRLHGLESRFVQEVLQLGKDRPDQ